MKELGAEDSRCCWKAGTVSIRAASHRGCVGDINVKKMAWRVFGLPKEVANRKKTERDQEVSKHAHTSSIAFVQYMIHHKNFCIT